MPRGKKLHWTQTREGHARITRIMQQRKRVRERQRNDLYWDNKENAIKSASPLIQASETLSPLDHISKSLDEYWHVLPVADKLKALAHVLGA